MPRTLFILNDAPYGSERSYNALRLAGSLARRPGEEVQGPASHHRVETGVCGSCMDARGISDAELADGVKRSSLSQLTDWTTWSDKTLVF